MTDWQLSVAEIAELAGGLAHELRNPLSTIMVNLKLLSEELQDETARPQDVRRRALLKLDTVQREAERLQNLFDDFLNLAGPCKLRRQELDLNGIVSRLIEFFEPVARGHGIQLVFRPSPKPVLCSVDEEWLGQALLNLVINAQQAMPAGGTLEMTVHTDGRFAVITVSDSGVGIAPGDRDRVFRPFYSTKPRGSGLGLSITQRIVHEHDGDLNFQSEVGKGTSFTLRLPLSKEFESQPGRMNHSKDACP